MNWCVSIVTKQVFWKQITCSAILQALHLIKQSEAHIVVGLFLLFFLFFLLSSFGFTSSSSSTASGGSGTTCASRWNTSKFLGSSSNKLAMASVNDTKFRASQCMLTNLVDVLALEFLQELLQTIFVGFDTNRLEQVGDVAGGWVGVAAEAKKEIGCEVLHFWLLQLTQLVQFNHV
jgi:hypothetical protein